MMYCTVTYYAIRDPKTGKYLSVSGYDLVAPDKRPKLFSTKGAATRSMNAMGRWANPVLGNVQWERVEVFIEFPIDETKEA